MQADVIGRAGKTWEITEYTVSVGCKPVALYSAVGETLKKFETDVEHPMTYDLL